jgi:cobalt-zinc-cadmium efflux system membrane fusion protein
VRPGELVKAGAPLATLQSADAASVRAALEQAGARSAAAADRLRRQNEMMARGIGLEVERFEAEIAVREATAELDRARRAAALVGAGRGDEVVLRAPAAGVVVAVRAAVGAVVQPGGEGLIDLADPARLWAVADVPEADRAGVAAGQPATIRVPGLDAEFAGVVDGIGSNVDQETRRVPIYVALQDRAPPGLTRGMLAEIRLVVPPGAGLSVPVAAVLIKDGTRRIVYVEREDGRLEPREVRTASSTSGGRVGILEGLRPGERVVVRGALLLDGEADQLL